MTDEEIKNKVQEAFGYSQKQLLKEWEAAEQILQDNPELRNELKPPKDEFEKIMRRLRKERNDCL